MYGVFIDPFLFLLLAGSAASFLLGFGLLLWDPPQLRKEMWM